MKSVLLSVLFLMMPVFLLAQDGKDKKTLLDSLENPTVKDNYTYYKIVKNHNIPSDSYEIRNYYRSENCTQKEKLPTVLALIKPENS